MLGIGVYASLLHGCTTWTSGATALETKRESSGIGRMISSSKLRSTDIDVTLVHYFRNESDRCSIATQVTIAITSSTGLSLSKRSPFRFLECLAMKRPTSTLFPSTTSSSLQSFPASSMSQKYGMLSLTNTSSRRPTPTGCSSMSWLECGEPSGKPNFQCPNESRGPETSATLASEALVAIKTHLYHVAHRSFIIGDLFSAFAFVSSR